MSLTSNSINDELFRKCMTNEYNSFDDFKKVVDATNANYNEIEDTIVLTNSIKRIRKEDNNNRKKYIDLLSDYKNIINKTSILSKELKLNNSLELSILYTYLLYCGYFSQNMDFKFKDEGRKMIPGLYSYDIMTGIGVCLNISDMLKDLLNNSGFKSSIMANYEYKNNPIEWLKLSKENSWNHAFNLIKENEKLYIYDPTNFKLVRIINIESACGIGNNCKFKLFPYESYFVNTRQEEIDLLDEFIKTSDFISPYDTDDFNNAKYNCLETVRYNKPLLRNYYDSTKENVNNIANKLLLIK